MMYIVLLLVTIRLWMEIKAQKQKQSTHNVLCISSYDGKTTHLEYSYHFDHNEMKTKH
jgi:hypothetical protein